MGRMTVADVGRKVDDLGTRVEGLTVRVDDLGARLDTRIDAVDAKVARLDEKVDTVHARVDAVGSDLGSRIAALTERAQQHERSTTSDFTGVQTAFDEMRLFVTESFGRLRTEMLQRFDLVDQRFERVDQRFDRMDRRFDRIEDKLDRALAHLPTAPRRRRKP